MTDQDRPASPYFAALAARAAAVPEFTVVAEPADGVRLLEDGSLVPEPSDGPLAVTDDPAAPIEAAPPGPTADAVRHLGGSRAGEEPCRCESCGCTSEVPRGEKLCAGCEAGGDHVPCAPGCLAGPPHVLRSGAIAAS